MMMILFKQNCYNRFKLWKFLFVFGIMMIKELDEREDNNNRLDDNHLLLVEGLLIQEIF